MHCSPFLHSHWCWNFWFWTFSLAWDRNLHDCNLYGGLPEELGNLKDLINMWVLCRLLMLVSFLIAILIITSLFFFDAILITTYTINWELMMGFCNYKSGFPTWYNINAQVRALFCIFHIRDCEWQACLKSDVDPWTMHDSWHKYIFAF